MTFLIDISLLSVVDIYLTPTRVGSVMNDRSAEQLNNVIEGDGKATTESCMVEE